jgi:hypothetical protein
MDHPCEVFTEFSLARTKLLEPRKVLMDSNAQIIGHAARRTIFRPPAIQMEVLFSPPFLSGRPWDVTRRFATVSGKLSLIGSEAACEFFDQRSI